jgi:hypothetical protein
VRSRVGVGSPPRVPDLRHENRRQWSCIGRQFFNKAAGPADEAAEKLFIA